MRVVEGLNCGYGFRGTLEQNFKLKVALYSIVSNDIT